MINSTILQLPITVDIDIKEVVGYTLSKIKSKEKAIITFINPHSFYIAKNNISYLQNLKKFNLILPDGIAITKAVEILLKQNSERISFDSSSLALPIFKLCADNNFSIMLIGGKIGVSEKCSEIIKKLYPEISIKSALNGFVEHDEIYKEILKINPDIIICGMGAPKQEEFAVNLIKKTNWNGVLFTCGGYFDQMLESGINYYPALIDKYNLRWAYRLFKEPKRLWRRYLIEYRIFIFKFLLAWFGYEK